MRFWKIKKMLLFLLVMVFTFGVYTVDNGYTAMTTDDSKLQIEMKRTKEDKLMIAAFGQTVVIDQEELSKQFVAFVETASRKCGDAYVQAMAKLGISDIEKAELPMNIEAMSGEVL